MMKLNFTLLFLSIFQFGFTQQPKNPEMRQLIEQQFDFAKQQYKIMDKNIPAGKTPQSYNEKTDKFIAYDIQWWCSGFYSGSLWYIFEQTKDEEIKAHAEKALKILEPNQTFTDNHDLGFMMNCSFGNAYRLTKNPAYKNILFRSAEALATRYRPIIKSIQSWNGSAQWKCPVIIDNMMNLEMLNWVTDNGGDKKFKEIAVNHANTALKNHFRPDFSSYHVVDYDLNTGEIAKKATWQGAANCSSWARGQGWGLYGYTLMYRATKDKKYLKQAQGIAKFIINHPNLPADKIPYWDFDAPFIPTKAKRDASAGALMASALLELGQYVNAKDKETYRATAETMLRSLASDNYRSKLGQNGGYLLMHSTGAFPQGSEIDVPLVYADYYFLEALARYKNWYL
jgi:unsaturated chondroitin disaccharide hydrolase